jgi:glucose-6-phosphate 1-dehydrogenase
MQLVVESVNMDFSYAGKWNKSLPEAYERLLLDALRGDSTLFTRSDEVEAEWEVIDTVVAGAAETEPAIYTPATWGPEAANQLLFSGSWRNE